MSPYYASLNRLENQWLDGGNRCRVQLATLRQNHPAITASSDIQGAAIHCAGLLQGALINHIEIQSAAMEFFDQLHETPVDLAGDAVRICGGIMDVGLQKFLRPVLRHDATIGSDDERIGNRAGMLFQFATYAAQNFRISVAPGQVQRLRWRPVMHGGTVQAVLAQVHYEIGQAIASEPPEMALQILGRRAPARSTKGLDHATAITELAGGG